MVSGGFFGYTPPIVLKISVSGGFVDQIPPFAGASVASHFTFGKHKISSDFTRFLSSLLGPMPEYVWLATRGKSQLGDKLNVLQQLTIIADRLIAQIRDGSLVPPSDCPTPTPATSHYGTPLENPDFLQIVPYISPEYQGVLALLMDELGLIPVDIRPLSQN